jgi:prepilin-type processing-associated H-X9-DG protein
MSTVNYCFSRGDLINNNTNPGNNIRGPFTTGRNVPLSEIVDGTSNTVAISEQVVYTGNVRDLKGSYCTVGNLHMSPIVAMAYKGPNNTLNCATFAASHHRRGESWASGFPLCTGFTTVLPPNSPIALNATGEWNWGVFPPQSHHPGGVNAAMCDGSVQFISETINTGNLALPQFNSQTPPVKESPYGVWGALGSMNGGEAVSVN